MATELRILDIPVDPFEAGALHGREAGDLIEANLRLYFDRFEREALLPPAEVRARAARYLEVIEQGSPDYALAMRGLCAASGFPLLDVAALNARYEILYSQYATLGKADAWHVPALECTAFAVLPEASADGHLWLGENWDWFPEVRGLVLRERGPDRVTAAFTEAGIVGGKIGMNSDGVGLVINGLMSNLDDWARVRTPFHVRTWRILHSATLDEAVAVVTGEERACSANFLIGQANGTAQVANIEAAPGATCRLLPHEGVLAHANHFSDPESLGVWQPLAEERTSTYQRGARVWRLLEEGRRDRTLDREGLMQILRDHDGHPESLCRHPNTKWPEVWRVRTAVSVLLDLTARQMYVAGGSPCETSYQTIDVAAKAS